MNARQAKKKVLNWMASITDSLSHGSWLIAPDFDALIEDLSEADVKRIERAAGEIRDSLEKRADRIKD